MKYKKANLAYYAKYEAMRRGINNDQLNRLMREDFSKEDVDRAIQVLSEMSQNVERPTPSLRPSAIVFPETKPESDSKSRTKSLIKGIN